MDVMGAVLGRFIRIGVVVPEYLRGNRLFQIEDSANNRDDVLVPFNQCRAKLREQGILLETADHSPLKSYDGLLFFCHDRNFYLKAARAGLLRRSAYVAWEPPTVDPLHEPRILRRLARSFGRVLTWNEDLLGEPGFGRIRYAQSSRMWASGRSKFDDRVLLANISGNKSSHHSRELYSERQRVLRYFQDVASDQLLMYGSGWDAREFPSYKGLAVDKASAYAGCRFALCFENMGGARGYITEKIFDCFRAGVVPIYHGAPDIEDYVPKGSYVPYMPGEGPRGLLDRLRSIDEKTHAGMLVCGREAVAALNAGPFSSAAMAEDVIVALRMMPNTVEVSGAFEYLARLTLRNLCRKVRA